MPEPSDAFQEAGGRAAIKAEPADGAAAEILAVDNGNKDGPEEAPPPPSKQEEAKHGGKGEAADDKLEKEAEKAKEKEKKKKFKVNEELLQAFRYFDRNCEYTSPLVALLPDGNCCCCIGALVLCGVAANDIARGDSTLHLAHLSAESCQCTVSDALPWPQALDT